MEDGDGVTRVGLQFPVAKCTRWPSVCMDLMSTQDKLGIRLKEHRAMSGKRYLPIPVALREL